MKNTVDLTENSVFASKHFDATLDNYFKKYMDEQRIPWRRPNKIVKYGLLDELSSVISLVTRENYDNRFYLTDDSFISYTDDFVNYDRISNINSTIDFHPVESRPVNEFPECPHYNTKCSKVTGNSLKKNTI